MSCHNLPYLLFSFSRICYYPAFRNNIHVALFFNVKTSLTHFAQHIGLLTLLNVMIEFFRLIYRPRCKSVPVRLLLSNKRSPYHQSMLQTEHVHSLQQFYYSFTVCFFIFNGNGKYEYRFTCGNFSTDLLIYL